MELNKLINTMSKNPLRYTIDYNIDRLDYFLSGVIYTRDINEVNSVESLFGKNFNKWVQKKYCSSAALSHSRWSQAILFYSGSQKKQ
jgi:hypothetical protein